MFLKNKTLTNFPIGRLENLSGIFVYINSKWFVKTFKLNCVNITCYMNTLIQFKAYKIKDSLTQYAGQKHGQNFIFIL
jgi:hypothetical protein